MKQIVQNYKTGELQLIEVPTPAVKKGFIITQNITSLLSIGTEKYMIELAKKSLFDKAKARPDLLKQVISKLKAEGIIETYKVVKMRLDNPVPLGYSCAGIVIEVGDCIEELKIGDRVACSGSGFASHAELVTVPENLCVKIPDNLDFESSAFATIGGIALQAVRLCSPVLGDKIAVVGLGLLGQIAVQILKSNGCHAFGIDISKEKAKMAGSSGAEEVAVLGETDVLSASNAFAPAGFDAVLIMAATQSNQPIELAAEMAREKAQIVACGLVGLEIPRKMFFEKELKLIISRAWGPGIFDPDYTEKNIDYPYPYVRWTAKRNLEEFLNLLSNGSIRVDHLITHRFPIEKALEAYEMILNGKEPYIGVLITYPEYKLKKETVYTRKIYKNSDNQKNFGFGEQNITNKATQTCSVIGIGCIGAGLFATGILLPEIKSLENVKLRGVATSSGIKAHHVAKKFNFDYFTTDYAELLNDEMIDLIFILTRHGSHAQFLIKAFESGKNVFVEKPLCINESQLDEIISVYNKHKENHRQNNQIIFVGFNRRFSPFVAWLKKKIGYIQSPLSINCIVNAGYIPANHWIHDPEDGGGRIIGEVCHFVDLIQYLTGAKIKRVFAETLDSKEFKYSDNVAITLKMANNSLGTITYLSGGDKRYPRERVEIYGGGAVGVIENFKKATFVHKGKKASKRNWIKLDRGYKGEIEALVHSILNKCAPPVDFIDYINTTLTTFAIEKSLCTGQPIEIKAVSPSH